MRVYGALDLRDVQVNNIVTNSDEHEKNMSISGVKFISYTLTMP